MHKLLKTFFGIIVKELRLLIILSSGAQIGVTFESDSLPDPVTPLLIISHSFLLIISYYTTYILDCNLKLQVQVNVFTMNFCIHWS